MNAMHKLMEKLKLTVNDDKTFLCQIPQERFDFLGYTFGRCYSSINGRAYIGTRPSKKKHQPNGEKYHRRDGSTPYLVGGRVCGGAAKSEVDGLGKLLLPGAG